MHESPPRTFYATPMYLSAPRRRARRPLVRRRPRARQAREGPARRRRLPRRLPRRPRPGGGGRNGNEGSSLLLFEQEISYEIDVPQG